MPFMYGLLSCLVGGVSGLATGMIVFPAIFLLFRFLGRKSGQRALLYSLATTFLLVMSVFCVSSYLFLSWSLSGPPSPREKPNEQDIIGIWQLSKDSLHMARANGYQLSTPQLEFREDGSFVMTDIPDIAINPWEPQHRVYSGAGTWDISRDAVNDEWDVEVHIVEFNGAETRFVIAFELYGETSPYKIYRWAGDPDTGAMWVFEKQ
jgi:hypothetical protein